MDDKYKSYLNSDAWKAKRRERLAIAQHRCAACPRKATDVHHLTYERIFNENMEDLLPLCHEHHQSAEILVECGLIKRFGNPLFLATETVRLILQECGFVAAIGKRAMKQKKVRNFKKTPELGLAIARLWYEQWFCSAIRGNRDKFIHNVKTHLKSVHNLDEVLWACLTEYDSRKKKELLDSRPDHGISRKSVGVCARY